MILAMATAPLPLIELRTLHCCTLQSIFSPQPPQECITPCTPLSRSASAAALPLPYVERESRSVGSVSLSRVRSQPPENAMHAHGFVQMYDVYMAVVGFPSPTPLLGPTRRRHSLVAKCMHLLASYAAGVAHVST
jgi:hypothetical protein